MTSEDARALSDAFERVIADPTRHAKAVEIGRQLDRDVRELATREGIELPPHDGDWVIDEEALRKFVIFLRTGSFRID